MQGREPRNLKPRARPKSHEPMPERRHLLRPEKERDLTRHLDMETPRLDEPADRDPRSLVRLLGRMRVDMSEVDREGDEMSGDDHSSGLQGGEWNEPLVDDGLPGEETIEDTLVEADLEKHRLDR